MARSRDATGDVRRRSSNHGPAHRTSRSASAAGRTADVLRPLRRHRGGWPRSGVDPPGADGDRRGDPGRDRDPVRLARTACPAGVRPGYGCGVGPFPRPIRSDPSKETAIMANSDPQPRRATRAARPSRAATSSSSGRTPTCSLHRTPTAGSVPNLKFSFAQAHTRVEKGGWTREVTTARAPDRQPSVRRRTVRSRAGRVPGDPLAPGVGVGVHARAAAAGSVPSTTEGRNFIEDVKVGDLWFFPQGVPHNIQALEDGARVPAGLRRRRLLGEQHLPAQRLLRPHPSTTCWPRTSAGRWNRCDICRSGRSTSSRARSHHP